MSGGFVKIYSSILDSSVWSEEQHTRLVWITLLAMADADGFVEAAVPGLARRANVPLEDCRAALERLMAPDPYSKSPGNEGRRVEPVERGWIILNYRQYRELRTPEQIAAAERQARYKARQRGVTADAGHGEKTPALSSASVSQTEEGEPSRREELDEAAACRATCDEYARVTGKPLDEILWEFSEFKGRRLVRLETAPLRWLKTTHDRIRAALIEARKASESKQSQSARPREFWRE